VLTVVSEEHIAPIFRVEEIANLKNGDEVEGTCSMHGSIEKFMYGFSWKFLM
jgi:hypothetical protein